MKKYYEFTSAAQKSIVMDYYDGCLSFLALGLKYETSQYHIQKILSIFASSEPSKAKEMEASRAKKKDRLKAEEAAKLPDDVESLKNEIRLLREEVKTAQMRAHAYNTMIDVAEEMYHIPIRKKHGAKR